MKLYFGILLLLFGLVDLSLSECPDVDDFAPCTCDGEGLNCRLAIDDLEVKRAFQTYSSVPTTRALFIQGTPITKLTKGIFGRYAVKDFYLDLNRISSVESGTFDNSLNLTVTLSLYKNQLESFPFQDLRKFTQLITFNLANNLLTTIPDYAFGKCPSLERLILMFNKITHIGKRAFDGLTNMQSLELVGNQLSVLGPESLSIPNHHAELSIQLSTNQIKNISTTAFQPSIPKYLLLDQNNLTSLPETSFKILVNSMFLAQSYIAVTENPFTCSGCDYRWLVKNRAAHDVFAGFKCSNGMEMERLTIASIRC